MGLPLQPLRSRVVHFIIDIITAFGSAKIDSLNLPTLPIGSAGSLQPLASVFGTAWVATNTQRFVKSAEGGDIVLSLIQDVSRPVNSIAGGGYLAPDEILVRVLAGDYDGNHLGGTGGRDATDQLDLNRHDSESKIAQWKLKLGSHVEPGDSSTNPYTLEVASGVGDEPWWGGGFDENDNAHLEMIVEDFIPRSVLVRAENLRRGLVEGPRGDHSWGFS